MCCAYWPFALQVLSLCSHCYCSSCYFQCQPMSSTGCSSCHTSLSIWRQPLVDIPHTLPCPAAPWLLQHLCLHLEPRWPLIAASLQPQGCGSDQQGASPVCTWGSSPARRAASPVLWARRGENVSRYCREPSRASYQHRKSCSLGANRRCFAYCRVFSYWCRHGSPRLDPASHLHCLSPHKYAREAPFVWYGCV